MKCYLPSAACNLLLDFHSLFFCWRMKSKIIPYVLLVCICSSNSLLLMLMLLVTIYIKCGLLIALIFLIHLMVTKKIMFIDRLWPARHFYFYLVMKFAFCFNFNVTGFGWLLHRWPWDDILVFSFSWWIWVCKDHILYLAWFKPTCSSELSYSILRYSTW